MKKRVISWLLCLALCLSMLPMAALAEDVQAPEGPAPSMNEPQPEEQASFKNRLSTPPFLILKHLISCPPISIIKSTSGRNFFAAVYCWLN